VDSVDVATAVVVIILGILVAIAAVVVPLDVSRLALACPEH